MRWYGYMLAALVTVLIGAGFFVASAVQEIQHGWGNPNTDTFQWGWIMLALSICFELKADKEEGS